MDEISTGAQMSRAGVPQLSRTASQPRSRFDFCMTAFVLQDSQQLFRDDFLNKHPILLEYIVDSAVAARPSSARYRCILMIYKWLCDSVLTAADDVRPNPHSLASRLPSITMCHADLHTYGIVSGQEQLLHVRRPAMVMSPVHNSRDCNSYLRQRQHNHGTAQVLEAVYANLPSPMCYISASRVVLFYFDGLNCTVSVMLTALNASTIPQDVGGHLCTGFEVWRQK